MFEMIFINFNMKDNIGYYIATLTAGTLFVTIYKKLFKANKNIKGYV